MTRNLRPATQSDTNALYAIHVAAMRDYVEQTWGWDDAQQYAFWREHSFPEREAIDVDGELAGFLDLEERHDHLWVGNLELHPRFQGRASAPRSSAESRPTPPGAAWTFACRSSK